MHGTKKNKSCKAFYMEKEVLYKKAESHQVKALKTLDRDNICTQLTLECDQFSLPFFYLRQCSLEA